MQPSVCSCCSNRVRMRNGRYIDDNGDVGWYLNNQLHRESGPAVELVNGTRKWYLHGQLHRDSGAAVVWGNGYRAWYLHGKRHCETGPAIEYHDSTIAWYLNDREYSFVEWLDLINCSPEQRTLLLLKWGSHA